LNEKAGERILKEMNMTVEQIVGIVVYAIITVCGFIIIKKAGFSLLLAFFALFPVANVIIYLVVALSKWPIKQEVEDYKRQIEELKKEIK
jgi:hypothetical protein